MNMDVFGQGFSNFSNGDTKKGLKKFPDLQEILQPLICKDTI